MSFTTSFGRSGAVVHYIRHNVQIKIQIKLLVHAYIFSFVRESEYETLLRIAKIELSIVRTL